MIDLKRGGVAATRAERPPGVRTACITSCEITVSGTSAIPELEHAAARRAGFDMTRPWRRLPQIADYIIIEQALPGPR